MTAVTGEANWYEWTFTQVNDLTGISFQFKNATTASGNFEENNGVEEILKKEILIHDQSYLNIFEYTKGDFAFKCEPFIFGDVVGLTIINNSIPPILIIDIFNMNKKELNIDFDFHIAYGNYETDDYVLGGKLTFRGYVIHILSELHKDYFKNVKIPQLKQEETQE